MRGLTVAVMLATGVALASCDKPKNEKQVTIDTDNGKVTMSGNDGKMTITGNDGKSVVEFNTNNAKLPPFVPAYPGAKVVTTMTANEGTNVGGTVVFTTGDAPDAVVSFYKSKVTGEGFKEAMTMNAGGTTMWSAQDEVTKKTVSVSASKTDQQTQVQVTWSGK